LHQKPKKMPRKTAEFSANKKWAVSPLISPPAGVITATQADKLVCTLTIDQNGRKFNHQLRWGGGRLRGYSRRGLRLVACFECRCDNHLMDPRDEVEAGQLDALAEVFCSQLMACLDECARGRKGLFSDVELLSEGVDSAWPEAARLRELALALQGIFAQQEQRNALCDEFLDLCSIHGESHPGERKLARAFLERIERGEVGEQPEGKNRPW
jgi:hypothetical protein